MADRVVADAVMCEPVSAVNSLLTGKSAGNFTRNAFLARDRNEKTPAAMLELGKFPAAKSREFSPLEQGRKSSDQVQLLLNGLLMFHRTADHFSITPAHDAAGGLWHEKSAGLILC